MRNETRSVNFHYHPYNFTKPIQNGFQSGEVPLRDKGKIKVLLTKSKCERHY